MNTTDTPTTDLVIIDADIVEDDANDGDATVGKTLATAGATSALVIGAVLAYKYVAPKVKSFIVHRQLKKMADAVETVEVPTETPETTEV